MLHVDDEERYARWRSWLDRRCASRGGAAGSRDERLQWMLFAALGQRKRPITEMGAVFAELWQAPGDARAS